MEAPATKSPNVRLSISIRDKKANDYTEILRGTSKGYEIVEVDGLVFKRKRQGSPGNANTAKKARAGNGIDEVQDMARQSESAGQTEPLQTHAAAASQTLPTTREANGETHSPANAEIPADGQDQATINAGHAENVALSVLRSTPDCSNETERMLAVCNVLGMVLQDEAVAAALKSSIAAAIEDGTLVCYKPPVQRSYNRLLQDDIFRKEAELQRQVAVLQQEEAEWQHLLETTSSPAHERQTTPAKSDEEHLEPVVEPSLKDLQQQSHLALSFQVEGLSRMISNAEQLQTKAESQCRLMQVEYHKEKFLNFPHIDSPARLIHDIVRERHF